MGILSSNASITRYQVLGQISDPVMDTLIKLLSQHTIEEIDAESVDKSIGWTSFEDPFKPDFSQSSFVIGVYFLFSFRIDKKAIPTKVVAKQYHIESEKRLKESGKEALSRNEKKQIKEDVLHELSLRIPATPNVFDILWNYEKSTLWFFSTQKSANEEFESFFTKTFKLNLIRQFPYTAAMNVLTENQKDLLDRLPPSRIVE